MVNYSVDMVARLAAADVHVHTLFVGQAIARSFQLGRGGKERLGEAIKNLSWMGTMGDIIHFGFGVDSVVRKLLDVDQGLVLVALCAATIECYDEDQAANIIWELVQLDCELHHFTPSAPQWKSLIKTCAGMLASTSFPKFAEHFMSLQRFADSDEGFRSHDRKCCSSPDNIAQALLGIRQVSTGKLLSIFIFGGSDAGWLAAVAEWLFDLRVVISTTTGQKLHTNCKDGDQVQVHVHFGKSSTDDRSQEIEVRRQIYHLRDISGIFERRDFNPGVSRVSGRVPWESALSHTFGSYFERLMNMERAFGYALGCAARVFEAIAKAETDIQHDASDCESYFSSSYGIGLVASMILTFPELWTLRQQMDVGAKKSTEEAIQAYDSSIMNIQSACACEICKAGGRVIGIAADGEYCLVFLVESILTLGRCLAGVSRAENLCPSLSGLQTWYRRQERLHQWNNGVNDFRGKRHVKIQFVLDFPIGKTLGGKRFDYVLQIQRLEDAAMIFGRGQIDIGKHKESSGISAVSVTGITVYLDVLSELSDDPERIGLCHVIPGHISMHGRSFIYISDLSDLDPEGEEYRARYKHGDEDVLRAPTALRDNYREVSLAALKSINSIQVGFLIKDSGAGVTLIPPAGFTLFFLRGFGLVRCNERICTGANKALPEEVSGSIVAKLDSGGLTEIWHFQGDLVARAIALVRIEYIEGWETGAMSLKPIIRSQECISCCVKRALASDMGHAIILSRR